MFKLDEVVCAINAQCDNMDLEKSVDGVSTDSRTISPGDIFVALSGDNFDGKDFAQQAIQKNALPKQVSTS